MARREAEWMHLFHKLLSVTRSRNEYPGVIEDVLNVPLQAGKGIGNLAPIIKDEKLNPVLVDNRAVKIHAQVEIVLEFPKPTRGPQKTVIEAEQYSSIVAIGS